MKIGDCVELKTYSSITDENYKPLFYQEVRMMKFKPVFIVSKTGLNRDYYHNPYNIHSVQDILLIDVANDKKYFVTSGELSIKTIDSVTIIAVGKIENLAQCINDQLCNNPNSVLSRIWLIPNGFYHCEFNNYIFK